MPWVRVDSVSDLLHRLQILPVERHNCHDCGAKPGEPHKENCDTEICSSCGTQRLCCDCPDHDPLFARWTGYWPGMLECVALGYISRWEPGETWTPMDGKSTYNADLNRFWEEGLNKVFFIKPKK